MQTILCWKAPNNSTARHDMALTVHEKNNCLSIDVVVIDRLSRCFSCRHLQWCSHLSCPHSLLRLSEVVCTGYCCQCAAAARRP